MKPAAILDIGSAKVVCLCGSAVHEDGILVHGVGTGTYPGFVDGVFTDEAALKEAVISAIEQAEQQSRIRIRELAVSVPAPFAHLELTNAMIRTESRKYRLTRDDINDVIAASCENAKRDGYVIMHSTPVSFTVNGITVTEEPVGERAAELEVTESHMLVKTSFIRVIEDILTPLDIEISMFLSADLANATHIIPPEERVRPAVLIDIGATLTSVCTVENNALTGLQWFDMGGNQFAGDLAFGLDIPLEYAEQVKRRHTFLKDRLSNVEIVRMPTGVKKFPQEIIDLIVDARAEELISLIKDALDKLDVRADRRPVVYLTGGGLSPLHGSGEYLHRQLGIPVKRDIPSYLHEMNSPNYTSAFGALDFVFRATMAVEQEDEPQQSSAGSLMDKLKNFFNQ